MIADIVDIVRHIHTGASSFMPSLGFEDVADKPIISIDDIETSYYLRLVVDDKPGFLSQLTTALSDVSIGLEAIHQEEPEDGELGAEIVLLTDKTVESNLLKALSKIESLGCVQGDVKKIRVETLG